MSENKTTTKSTTRGNRLFDITVSFVAGLLIEQAIHDEPFGYTSLIVMGCGLIMLTGPVIATWKNW